MTRQQSSNHTVAFIGPSAGVKPFVVLSSLLESYTTLDWSKSIVVTDAPAQSSRLVNLVHEHNLNHLVVSDLSLATEVRTISEQAPHFLVSCGWGKRISTKALEIPSIAALNCHSSYLPDYKGADVVQHYRANCEEWMGATVHYMTEKFDDGNIVSQQKLRVFRWDTPSTMLWRISELTAVLLREALLLTSEGYLGTPHSGGRYFLKISRRKLWLYRLYNLFAVSTGLPRRLTPHRGTGPQ